MEVEAEAAVDTAAADLVAVLTVVDLQAAVAKEEAQAKVPWVEVPMADGRGEAHAAGCGKWRVD